MCVCVLMVEKFPVFRRPGQKASGTLASTQKEQARIGETASSNWCLNTGGWVLRDLVGLHPASVLSLSGGVGISWLSPQSSVYFRLWKWQSRPENISETGTMNALATELWNENTQGVLTGVDSQSGENLGFIFFFLLQTRPSGKINLFFQW